MFQLLLIEIELAHNVLVNRFREIDVLLFFNVRLDTFTLLELGDFILTVYLCLDYSNGNRIVFELVDFFYGCMVDVVLKVFGGFFDFIFGDFKKCEFFRIFQLVVEV